MTGLPLLRPTATGWAAAALRDISRLLVDHAHCEHKAASSALRLISRFPDHAPIIRPLLSLAAEEMRHFRQVLDLLENRNIPLSRPQPDRYVNLLRRRFTSQGHGIGGLGDHLLVAAFVEARSCERLRLLAAELTDNVAAAGNAAAAPDLQEFYSRLAAAEARHWVLFHELAAGCTPEKRLNRRMNELAAMESDIMDSLPHAPRMH